MRTIRTLAIAAIALLLSSVSFAQDFPVKTFAWSEYPSWSAIGIAGNADIGLVNPQKGGKHGTLELKHQVDLVFVLADYEACFTLYGSGKADFVCITNMDILSPSLRKKSVAILPTSTSYGADACIVTQKVTSVDDLQKISTHGLDLSVSEYTFVRNLEKAGKDPAKFKFESMGPDAAAVAMQTGKVESIVVWNPFVLETLDKRKDSRVIFDSTTIPGEIIDMVVASDASLKQEGGKAAALCIVDAYYSVCRRMEDPKTRDKTLIAIGEKFSNLGLRQMRKVVKQTLFYETPKMGISAFTGGSIFPFKEGVSKETLEEVMPRVVKFCVAKEMVEKAPKISYGPGDAALVFDASYMKQLAK